MARILYLRLVILLCLVPLQVACAKNEAPLYPLEIVSADGRTLLFHVEVADTDQERARGLMFRKEMQDNHGMIFLFDREQALSFWMHNTYLPLDILYIDRQGRVVSIKQGQPLDETPIPSGAPAKAVLELNQGTAHRLGIKVGDQVYFSQFSF